MLHKTGSKPKSLVKIFSRLWYLRRAVGLVWQSSPGWTLIGLVLTFLQGVLPLGLLYLTRLVIDALTLRASTQRPDWQAAFWEIAPLLGLTVALALLLELAGALAGLVTEAQSQAVTDYVRNLLHAKSVELDLEYYENAAYYDALHRAQSEATYRPTLILNRLTQGVQSTLSLAGIALLLLSLHWATGLILLVAVLPGLFLRLKHSNRLYRKWQEWTPQERRAEYFSRILTREEYAKEVRLFGLGRLFQGRYAGLRRQVSREKLELARLRVGVDIFVRISAGLVVYAAWCFMVYQTFAGTLTLGGLVMYFAAFQRGQLLLQEAVSSLALLYENSLFVTNFYQFLDLKPVLAEPSQPRPVPQPFKQGISFEGVTFGYSGTSRPVLADLNFTIRAGETVALVGANGAGKTTLIKLLCRLYDPTAGRITLDGVDLREFSSLELRRQISVVFQDYVHYNLNVWENIGFGKIEPDGEAGASASPSPEREAQIIQAAQEAGAAPLIARLPHGYDTTLGHQFEDGHELSIGEWQKLAIARVFLGRASLVVLDEPTSALDAEAEFAVLDQFRRLTEGCTAILISHRLSTVRLADRIIVLDEGQVRECGTHDELVALQGLYAHMFQTQAQYYR